MAHENLRNIDIQKLASTHLTLLMTGSMNPPHPGHVLMMIRDAAKQLHDACTEAQLDGRVDIDNIFLSPTHDAYVAPKARSNKRPFLPAHYRADLLQTIIDELIKNQDNLGLTAKEKNLLNKCKVSNVDMGQPEWTDHPQLMRDIKEHPANYPEFERTTVIYVAGDDVRCCTEGHNDYPYIITTRNQTHDTKVDASVSSSSSSSPITDSFISSTHIMACKPEMVAYMRQTYPWYYPALVDVLVHRGHVEALFIAEDAGILSYTDKIQIKLIDTVVYELEKFIESISTDGQSTNIKNRTQFYLNCLQQSTLALDEKLFIITALLQQPASRREFLDRRWTDFTFCIETALMKKFQECDRSNLLPRLYLAIVNCAGIEAIDVPLSNFKSIKPFTQDGEIIEDNQESTSSSSNNGGRLFKRHSRPVSTLDKLTSYVHKLVDDGVGKTANELFARIISKDERGVIFGLRQLSASLNSIIIDQGSLASESTAAKKEAKLSAALQLQVTSRTDASSLNISLSSTSHDSIPTQASQTALSDFVTKRRFHKNHAKRAEGTRQIKDAETWIEKVKSCSQRAEEDAQNVFLFYHKDEYGNDNSAIKKPENPLIWEQEKFLICTAGGRNIETALGETLQHKNPGDYDVIPTHNVMVAVNQDILSYGGYFATKGKPQPQTPTMAHVVLASDYEFERFNEKDLIDGKCPFIKAFPMLAAFSIDPDKPVLRQNNEQIIVFTQDETPYRFELDGKLYQQEITQHLLSKMRAALVSHHQTKYAAKDLEFILHLPGMGAFANIFGSPALSITRMLAPLAAVAYKNAFNIFDQEQKNARLYGKGQITVVRLVQPAESNRPNLEAERKAIDTVFFEDWNHNRNVSLSVLSKKEWITENEGIKVTVGPEMVENFTKRGTTDRIPVIVIAGDARTHAGNETSNDSQEPAVISKFVYARAKMSILQNPGIAYQMNAFDEVAVGWSLRNTYQKAVVQGKPTAAELIAYADTLESYMSPNSSIGWAINLLEISVKALEQHLQFAAKVNGNEKILADIQKCQLLLASTELAYDVRLAMLMTLSIDTLLSTDNSILQLVVNKLNEQTGLSWSAQDYKWQITHALYQMRKIVDLPDNYVTLSRECDLTSEKVVAECQRMLNEAFTYGSCFTWVQEDDSTFKLTGVDAEKVVSNIRQAMEIQPSAAGMSPSL